MQSNPIYYDGYNLLSALMACLTLESPEVINSVEAADTIWFHSGTHCVRRVWGMFCEHISSECQDLLSPGKDPMEAPKNTLINWLEANSQFQIQGRTL